MFGKIIDNQLIKREKEASKLRMGGGSWTINLSALPEAVDKVVYITETAKYEITLSDAFKHGFTRDFKGETKLIVPIKYWHTTPS